MVGKLLSTIYLSFHLLICSLIDMKVTSDVGSEVVYKWARTAEERQRLAHEAAVLAAVAHPGVVQVVGVREESPPLGWCYGEWVVAT